MHKKEFNKYSTLLSLYLAQSIPMSFFSTVVPVIMRMENFSLESIGYLQLVKLPWILKFLWAPVVDKTSSSPKQYRKWIILSEIFYAVVILHIAFFDLSTNFFTIVVLMVIAFAASATQDVATDAFAILILKKEERSIGNSMQSGGNFLGALFGSGVLLIIYHYWGWQYLIVCLAFFVLVALVPVILHPTKKYKNINSKYKDVSPIEFFYFFRQKRVGGHLIVLFLFYSGLIGILTMIKPYLVDLGYEVKDIGFISGIFGTACGALITMPAGLFFRKFGLFKSIWVVATINLTVAFYFWGLTFTTHPLYMIYIGVALLWSAYAISSVYVYTLAMRIVRKGKEGTDFTIQIVITHLSSLVIAVSSGKIADALTYRGLFAIEIGLNILFVGLLIFFYKPLFYKSYVSS